MFEAQELLYRSKLEKLFERVFQFDRTSIHDSGQGLIFAHICRP